MLMALTAFFLITFLNTGASQIDNLAEQLRALLSQRLPLENTILLATRKDQMGFLTSNSVSKKLLASNPLHLTVTSPPPQKRSSAVIIP